MVQKSDVCNMIQTLFMPFTYNCCKIVNDSIRDGWIVEAMQGHIYIYIYIYIYISMATVIHLLVSYSSNTILKVSNERS